MWTLVLVVGLLKEVNCTNKALRGVSSSSPLLYWHLVAECKAHQKHFCYDALQFSAYHAQTMMMASSGLQRESLAAKGGLQ
jgi:hypothetical protein